MMRLLLDTHVAVWSVLDTRKIPHRILRMVADPDSEVFVSTVSVWEVGLKFGARRSQRLFKPREDLAQEFELAGYGFLDVSIRHAIAFENFALAHPDPFDRMILTQALVEQLRLVTADARLAAYSDTTITW